MNEALQSLLTLDGRVAWVTGAGRGIGRAIAERLAQAGAAVVLSDLNESDLDEAASVIRKRGGNATAIVSDASQMGEADRVTRLIVKQAGRIDILVNNAAVFIPEFALNVTERDWDKMIDLDLKSLFFHCQCVTKQMVSAARGGRIVNISSLAALHPAGCLSVYEAAKGGVLALTRSLAKEFGPYGITVNAIAPGSIQTPGSKATRAKMAPLLGNGAGDKVAVRSVLGRIGEADDIANGALYLACDLSTYVTGITLVVDGGYALL